MSDTDMANTISC